MIDYLASASDDVQKADVATRVGGLAERYAPDARWYVAVMNRVFELGGDAVPAALADGLVRLVADGAGDGDAVADAALRSEAAAAYLAVLDRPKLSARLLTVAAWVLGEYGHLAGAPPADVLDALARAADSPAGVEEAVRSVLVTAMLKLATHAGVGLPAAADALLRVAAGSRCLDLAQRAAEAMALLEAPAGLRAAALPVDGAAEDVCADAGLAFLDGHVGDALAAGAAPYLTPDQRAAMGAARGGRCPALRSTPPTQPRRWPPRCPCPSRCTAPRWRSSIAFRSSPPGWKPSTSTSCT